MPTFSKHSKQCKFLNGKVKRIRLILWIPALRSASSYLTYHLKYKFIKVIPPLIPKLQQIQSIHGKSSTFLWIDVFACIVRFCINSLRNHLSALIPFSNPLGILHFGPASHPLNNFKPHWLLPSCSLGLEHSSSVFEFTSSFKSH